MKPSSDPGIALKTTPPKLRRSMLSRKRLNNLRSYLDEASVIVVEAPSGFGKTTTLAQWRADWQREGAIVPWLSVYADDDSARLAVALVESFRRGLDMPKFGTSIPEAPGHPGGVVETLTVLLAEIAALPRQVVLIFDDADRASNEGLRSSLAYLFNNVPPNLRIVVGVRSRQPLDFSARASRGEMGLVTSLDLRFDLAETIAFVTSRLGSRIGTDECARIHELTEGWPMGLQLAASALERSSSVEMAIASMSAASDQLMRSLIEGAIATLPAEFRHFVTCCSLLDALHPALCKAVTRDERAAEYLYRLLSDTPLVTAGEDSEWMRLHALAREYFKEQSRQLSDQEINEIHVRAEEWLANNGLPEQAADHAFAASRTDQWIKLIAGCLYDLLLKGQLGLLGDWCARLPAEAFDLDPKVRIAAAWSIALSERAHLVRPQLEPLISSQDIDVETHDEAALIMSSAALLEDDLESTRTWLSRLSGRDMSSDHPLIQSVHGGLLAYLAIHEGATERGRYYLLRARSYSSTMAYRAYGEFFVGLSYLWEGRATLAEGILHGVNQQFEKETGRRGLLATMIASGLAAACWDLNKRDEARTLLANRMDVLERCALPAAVVLGYQTLAKQMLEDGEETRALALLEELSALGEARSIKRFQVASLVERVRIHAIRRRSAQCASLIERLDAVAQGLSDECTGASSLSRLLATLGRSYAAIAADKPDIAAACLDEALACAKSLNRGLELIQALALKAFVGSKLGLLPAAYFAILDESLSLAESYGLVRAYADTLPEVVELVSSRLQGNDRGGISAEFAKRLLEVKAQAEAPGAPEPSLGANALLTPKEHEVLCLLAKRLPNKRIAEALDVSGETVKWHLKNLFSKLNAASREHAVHRARMLGIL